MSQPSSGGQKISGDLSRFFVCQDSNVKLAHPCNQIAAASHMTIFMDSEGGGGSRPTDTSNFHICMKIFFGDSSGHWLIFVSQNVVHWLQLNAFLSIIII